MTLRRQEEVHLLICTSVRSSLSVCTKENRNGYWFNWWICRLL